jgi:hypothetical protein
MPVDGETEVFEKELKMLIGSDLVSEITPVGRIYYETQGKKNTRACMVIKSSVIYGNAVLVRRYNSTMALHNKTKYPLCLPPQTFASGVGCSQSRSSFL